MEQRQERMAQVAEQGNYDSIGADDEVLISSHFWMRLTTPSSSLRTYLLEVILR